MEFIIVFAIVGLVVIVYGERIVSIYRNKPRAINEIEEATVNVERNRSLYNEDELAYRKGLLNSNEGNFLCGEGSGKDTITYGRETGTLSGSLVLDTRSTKMLAGNESVPVSDTLSNFKVTLPYSSETLANLVCKFCLGKLDIPDGDLVYVSSKNNNSLEYDYFIQISNTDIFIKNGDDYETAFILSKNNDSYTVSIMADLYYHFSEEIDTISNVIGFYNKNNISSTSLFHIRKDFEKSHYFDSNDNLIDEYILKRNGQSRKNLVYLVYGKRTGKYVKTVIKDSPYKAPAGTSKRIIW